MQNKWKNRNEEVQRECCYREKEKQKQKETKWEKAKAQRLEKEEKWVFSSLL